ncbi:helix-turn-helix domain-containing protein [Sinomonas halotolerans]|uniref:Helix-turn-helix domain-containing protein n=1 Tax=Sinomonas halotolerans TaxID=1644133 RepID=A0ABU9WVZ9_9MICC
MSNAQNAPAGPRFLTLKDVQAELQVSPSQALALVRRGELRAIQVGGRGQWRIERSELEAYIQDAYRRTAEAIATGQLEPADGETQPDAG